MLRLSLFFFSQIGATDNPGPTYHAAGVAHAARTFLTANMLTERKLIANEGCIEHDRSSAPSSPAIMHKFHKPPQHGRYPFPIAEEDYGTSDSNNKRQKWINLTLSS